MSRKWMFLWSAFTVVLLWRSAAVTDRRPIFSFLTDTVADTALSNTVLSDSVLPDEALSDGTPPNPVLPAEDSTTMANDQLAHPPLSQPFITGDYRFVVTAIDQWQTPAVMGTLYQGDRLVWEKSLPHQYGPRFVVVGPQGQVLLADEFINVASPYALMLLDARGESIATYAFADIQQTLSVSAAVLTQQATSGWWLSAEPYLAPSEPAQAGDSTAEARALIPTGGTYLTVNLSTGELTRQQDL